MVLVVFQTLLAFLVLLRKVRTRANVLFFGVSISLSLWTLCWFLFVTSANPFWIRFTFAWGGIILSLYWLIGRYFLSKRPLSRPLLLALVLLNMGITYLSLGTKAFISEVKAITEFGYLSVPGPLHLAYRLFIAAGIIVALVTLVSRIRSARSHEQRTKLRWIFSGTLIFSVFAGFNSALSPLILGNTNITGFGPISALPYTVFFAIAIVRYRISDIREDLFKAILRFATISVLFAAVAIVISTPDLLNSLARLDRLALFVIIWLAIYLIYFYIHYFIPFVDRFFHKREQRVYKKLSELGYRLLDVTNYDDLIYIVPDILRKQLDYEPGAFLILDDPEEQITQIPGRLGKLAPFLLEENSIFEREILRQRGDLCREEQTLLQLLEENEASLLMPIVFQNTLFAILFISGLTSGRLPSSLDITTLEIVRSEVAAVFFRIRLVRRLAISEAHEFYNHQLMEKNRQLIERNRIIERDMEMARRIQQTLIPQRTPSLPKLNLAKLFIPLDKIAGDFFDFFALRRNRLGIFIGDVSGHGVPSAFIASMAKMLLSSCSNDFLQNPAQVMGYLNLQLIENLVSNFITAIYGVLDMETGLFEYTCAGHPPPLYQSPDQEMPHPLEVYRQAIGMLPASDFPVFRLQCEPGSRIYLFTDGCFEVYSEQGEEFGEERLARFLGSMRSVPLAQVGDRLLQEIQAFCSFRELEDDVTMVLLELTG